MKNRILKTTVALLSLGTLCFAGLSPADDRSPEEIAQSLMEKLTHRVNENVVVPLSPDTPWTLRFSRALPAPKERIFFEVPDDAITKAGGAVPDQIPFTIFREDLRAKAKNPDLKPQRIVSGVYEPATDEISLDDPRIENFIVMKKQLDLRKLEAMLSAAKTLKPQVKPGESDI